MYEKHPFNSFHIDRHGFPVPVNLRLTKEQFSLLEDAEDVWPRHLRRYWNDGRHKKVVGYKLLVLRGIEKKPPKSRKKPISYALSVAGQAAIDMHYWRQQMGDDDAE